MSNFESAAFDRQCRRSQCYTNVGRTPPPALQVSDLARRFHLSEAKVIEHLEAMRKPKESV